MIKNLIVTLTTGALLTATIATAAVCTMTRSGKTKLLPTANIQPAMIETTSATSEDTKVTEPLLQVEKVAFEAGEPATTETVAVKPTAAVTSAVKAMKSTKKNTKKTSRKATKKTTKKTTKINR